MALETLRKVLRWSEKSDKFQLSFRFKTAEELDAAERQWEEFTVNQNVTADFLPKLPEIVSVMEDAQAALWRLDQEMQDDGNNVALTWLDEDPEHPRQEMGKVLTKLTHQIGALEFYLTTLPKVGAEMHVANGGVIPAPDLIVNTGDGGV